MRLRGVGKRYGRRNWVLANVDVDLPRGEQVAVRGGNGSGKSTLLRIMVGVTRPSTGWVEHRPREIGWVPDRFPSDERMSARAYLRHMGRIRGLPTKTATRRTDELLTRLALVGGADSPLRELSKGNARKVALAQALLVPPSVLVMDEPWSGLDYSAHAALLDIMEETTRSGGAVVFTDHDESLVQAQPDRIYHVGSGRVALGKGTTRPVPPRQTRVVLRAPAGEPVPPRTGEWLALDGVVSAHTSNERLVVDVEDEHTDQLVLSALHGGWSLIAANSVDTSATGFGGNSR